MVACSSPPRAGEVSTQFPHGNLLSHAFAILRFFLTTVVCDLLTSRLQQESCRLNKTYNIFTTVA